MTLKASLSEPLSISAGRHTGALLQYNLNPLVSVLAEQLCKFALEQQSVARRTQELSEYILRQLPSLAPHQYWARNTSIPFTAPWPLVPNSRPSSSLSLASAPSLHADQPLDVIRQKNRQLMELLSENDSLRSQLASTRKQADKLLELEEERKRRIESESSAARAAEILIQQNVELADARDKLEEELKDVKADLEAWKTDANTVQDMQEVAIRAFARCNALETENEELKQAIDAFAEGSASSTVQQLQKVVASLTEEVMQYRKREGDLKAKENLARDKENNSIIRAMRKQTRELKRRSLQTKHTDLNVGLHSVTDNEATFTVQVSMTKAPSLPTVPSFSEFFLM